MCENPETRESLLIRIRNPQDQDAWDEFARIYRPVVYRLTRLRGLQDADAEDLVQKVLTAVASAIPNWKRSDPNARFYHWLSRVAKNAVINALVRQPKDRAVGGTTATELLNLQRDRSIDSSVDVDLEYRRQLYRRAAEVVRGRADEVTWLAFSLTMVDGLTIAKTARQLDRSEGMIYAARSRIIRRLRNVIRDLEDK